MAKRMICKSYISETEFPTNIKEMLREQCGMSYEIDNDTLLSAMDHFLNDDEKMVMHQRFKQKKTLIEVGQAMGKSSERIRQHQTKALWKLKKAFARMFDPPHKKESIVDTNSPLMREKIPLERALCLSPALIDKLQKAGCKYVSDVARMNIDDITKIQNIGFYGATKIEQEVQQMENMVKFRHNDTPLKEAFPRMPARALNVLRDHGFVTVSDLAYTTPNKTIEMAELGSASAERLRENLNKLTKEENEND